MDDIARRLADRWAFSPREELEAGYCSRVYVDENRALKVPWRGEEMTSGYKAAWDLSGWWGPEVFEGDEATGAILMARVVPGQDLSRTPEAEALEVTTGLISQLGRVSPEGYPGLDIYYSAFGSSLFERLMETSPSPVFLHGDLHHFNILWSEAENRWVPIDPKGVAGDPAYEAIAFLRNCLVGDIPALLRSRLDFFSERLGLDPWRMAAWCLVDQLAAIEEDPDCVASPEAKALQVALGETVGS